MKYIVVGRTTIFIFTRINYALDEKEKGYTAFILPLIQSIALYQRKLIYLRYHCYGLSVNSIDIELLVTLSGTEKDFYGFVYVYL